jgi:hypothetical protein
MSLDLLKLKMSGVVQNKSPSCGKALQPNSTCEFATVVQLSRMLLDLPKNLIGRKKCVSHPFTTFSPNLFFVINVLNVRVN